jgi:serine/threonine protein kinase
MTKRTGPPTPWPAALPDEVFATGAGAARPGAPTVPPTIAESEPPELPEVGTVIDRYRIEGVIGRGGFAVVFRGRHVMLDMPVAIKLLRPSVVRRAPHLAMTLCDEARLAARIAHPNVVRVHDVHHSDAITFIVMELCEGETLSELIARKGRVAPARALRIGHAVACGLRAGLAGQIIHRDIKPANIIVTTGGAPKVVDLGLARRISAAIDERPAPRGMVGTPGYMAPEQALDPDGVDFRADVYALGVTLYHAVVGAPPFATGDPLRALALHQSAAITPPSARAPGLPAAVDHLLLWMLERNRERRPASYDVLIAAMRRTLDDLERADRER